jgi:hypothetical protein
MRAGGRSRASGHGATALARSAPRALTRARSLAEQAWDPPTPPVPRPQAERAQS